jgi:uncharacterized protein (TIGR01244 family)
VSDFRPLSERFAAAPQISEADVAEARSRGFSMIINNRPEHESDDQTSGADIEAAARAAGLDYVVIPITHAGFSETQVDGLIEAMERADGPILAYCRSGTRSTLLWALAQARLGNDPAAVAAQARAAGYDVSPVMPLMDMLFGRSRG